MRKISSLTEPFGPPRGHHAQTRVADGDAAVGPGHEAGHVPGTACQIDNVLAGFGSGESPQGTLPQTVNAEAHQVVHQIVPGGDLFKHLTDLAFTLLGLDFLVAEGLREFGCHGGSMLFAVEFQG